MKNFIHGFKYLLRGFQYLSKPGLKRYFAIPLFLNIAVFSLLTYFGYSFFQEALGWLIPEGDSIWIDVANVLALVLFTPVLLIAVYLIASVLANFIASPFNDLLSEKVEARAKNPDNISSDNSKSVLQAIAAMGPVLAGEVKKYIYFGLFYIPIVIITFIPLINVVIAPIAWVIFGMWMLALEYLAFPIQNRGYTFLQVREFARKNRMRSMGFGSSVLLATLIPLVNFIVIPAAVAGATLLWVESNDDN